MILDVTERNGMKQDTVIGVAMRHFDAAFKKIKPSVSEKVGLLFYAYGVLPNGGQCCNDSSQRLGLKSQFLRTRLYSSP